MSKKATPLTIEWGTRTHGLRGVGGGGRWSGHKVRIAGLFGVFLVTAHK